MSQRDVAVTEFTCDGCGRRALIDVEAVGPPIGYHITVTEVTGAGAGGGEVYACRRSCILKAVDAAGVDEDQRVARRRR